MLANVAEWDDVRCGLIFYNRFVPLPIDVQQFARASPIIIFVEVRRREFALRVGSPEPGSEPLRFQSSSVSKFY